jgi:hypothetical protein
VSLTALGTDTKLLKLDCRGSSLVERRPEKAGVASSILAPGTTGMRQLFFTKKIYFAVSEIGSFSILGRGFERQLAYSLSDGFMRFLDVLGVCE